MKLKAGELSFNVLESGSGEPALLFLHYWGGSARSWNAVTSQLSTNFRCIAYDQRGWGQSDAPEQGYSIRDLALDAKHIVEALHLRRYVLVGHSMGGKVLSSWHRSGRQGWWDLFWLRPRLQRRKTFRNLQSRLSFTPTIVARMLSRRWRSLLRILRVTRCGSKPS